MEILDGKKLAKKIRQQVKGEATQFVERWGRPPSLHVILVGDDPASHIYVRNKERACKKTGVASHQHLLPQETGQAELLQLIRKLNADNDVDAILVQMPLPKGIDSGLLLSAIAPTKDVDGFHPINLGKLYAGRAALRPCTPLACMRLIEETGVELPGKNAVVVGRSTVVGKPVAALLLEQHATVTICHSRTRNLAHVIAEADVLVAAAGSPELIKGEWLKRDAIAIDVGINRLEDGTLTGDLEFEAAAARASWITPVPGGVGPMTVAMVVANTLTAANARLTG